MKGKYVIDFKTNTCKIISGIIEDLFNYCVTIKWANDLTICSSTTLNILDKQEIYIFSFSELVYNISVSQCDKMTKRTFSIETKN